MTEIDGVKNESMGMEVVKCPICNHRMFDIEDKSKCKTNIAIKCTRCKRIILINMNNPCYIEQRKVVKN